MLRFLRESTLGIPKVEMGVWRSDLFAMLENVDIS